MRVGFVMRRLVLWALVFCLVAQFGGCKSSTVSEVALEPPPQSKPRDTRLARLYFLREKGLVGTEVGIKIDGKPVGSVAKGLYFFSDRPPRRYATGGCARSKSSQSGCCRQQRTANAADVPAHGGLFWRRPLSNRCSRGSCRH